MILNKQHMHFDMTMELLCSLPQGPARAASSATLAHDLGINGAQGISRLGDMLLKRGYLLERSVDENHHRMLAVRHDGWERAEMDCQDYWKRVYG